MLVEFESCGDCECQICLESYRCSKAGGENPCIDCEGIPPYAEGAKEDSLYEFSCEKAESSIRIISED